MLTSRSEGLSIAMAEAMSAGAVPVVADVGELRDLVTDGVNGYLIGPNNIDEYAKGAMSLLQDHVLWTQYSRKAMETVKKRCGIESVSRKWQQHIREAVAQAPGHCVREVRN